MARIQNYRIVIGTNPTVNEKRAAAFAAKYIKLVTGVWVDTVTDDTAPQPLEIAVGRTNREALDGLAFDRCPDRNWEYTVQLCGRRLYLTGFGCPKGEARARQVVNDYCLGTVLAAYHFVEHILGFEFVYETYDRCPEVPELPMPECYHFEYTTQALAAQLPEKMEGSAMYLIPTCCVLEWNMCSVVLKTRSGKLVVMDGGHGEDAEHVLRCLEHLADGEKPVISAWLFSHIHPDHYGMLYRLCTEPELAKRVEIRHFYGHLLPHEFYAELSKERDAEMAEARDQLWNMGSTLGVTMHQVEKGDSIQVDELRFDVIHVPDMADAREMNMNDSSTVYKLTHDSGQRILFLGDAETVCARHMLREPELLRSDVVQVGHHGCWSVDFDTYAAIDADAYFFEIGCRFWFGDKAEGLNTHNTGVIRSRNFIRELGKKRENIHRDTDGILSFSLPMPII